MNTGRINAIKAEQKSLQGLIEKLEKLSPDEAKKLLQATDHLSVSSLAKLFAGFSDKAKVGQFIDDVLKSTDDIDTKTIRAILTNLWETKMAQFFEQGGDITKGIMKDLKAIHINKVAVKGIDEAIIVIGKLFKKIV